MAQFGDFLGRLFSTGDSRGLSGDVDLVLPSEPELAFYNEGLSRHRTDGDLVSDPDQLWTPTGRNRQGGLAAHLLARRSEGVINFTDILIIVNRTDWERAVPGMTSVWPDKAARTLLGRFESFCEEENLHLLFPQRPMQFHLIQDGGPRMEGEDIGLEEGEFVTGLLANQHGRPTSHSRALIAIHLNLPGTWEGYYEVGRLYNDQALFTLGNHWLDNFSHPALPRPALYRLQQQEDGSFVHIIDPEVAELFEITSQGPDSGPSVLTIQSINGTPVAHLVLEVISATADPEAMTRALPASELPTASPSGHGSATRNEEVTAIYNLPMNTSRAASNVAATRTIIPDAVSERILTLRERGALLQKVHFSRFMLGYDVYIGRSGEVGTAIPDPVATIQVRRRQVNLFAHFPGLSLNGKALPPGTPTSLEGDNEIDLGGQRILYTDLRGVPADGWPYVGEIRRGGSNIHLIFGKGHQLGRARSCQVTLPDKPHNENIVWRTEVGEGATIRVRSGEIPKAQFYTDSIMVASLHAEVDLSGEPMLVNRARHCHTFVRRRKDVFSLYPTKDQNGPTNLDLQPGDQILIGNSVFEVDYPPADGPRRPSSSVDLMEVLSPGLLAAAIDEDEDGAPQPLEDVDLPPARGLGERGSPPPAIELTHNENDSIFDIDPRKPGIFLPDVTPANELPPERIAAPMILDTIDESIDLPEPIPSIPPPLQPVPAITPLSALDAPSLSDVIAPPPLPESAPPPLPESAPPPSPISLPGDAPPPSVVARSDLGTATSFLDESEFFDMTGLGVEEIPDVPEAEEVDPSDLPEPDVDEEQPTVVMAPLREDYTPPGPPPLPTGPPPLPTGPPALPSAPPALPSAPPTLPADDEPVTTPSIPEETPENVAVVEESQCQFELSRPGRLTLVGWTAYGDITIGNHHDAAAVIPENRSEPDQTFFPQDYFSLFVRGRRLKARRVALGEARLISGDKAIDETTEAEGLVMEVVRRDPDGEPDFFVTLTLQQDRRLPDPRSRLLSVAQDDPMVEALFTIGLPLRTPRTVTLSGLTLTAQFDGTSLTVTDYLDSYKQDDGSWHPFFIRHGEGRFQTAPEDGSPITLTPGDLLLSGTVIHCFESR